VGIDKIVYVLSHVFPASCFGIVYLGFWMYFIQTGKWTCLPWMVAEESVILLLFLRESHLLNRRLSRDLAHPQIPLATRAGIFR
jgi:hypothetical protein